MDPFDPPYQYIREMGFPTVKRLKEGILLGCIAQSFWLIAREPVSEQFWDGDTYVDDQMQGERWAVAFSERGTVAVFYSTESCRNPYPEGSAPYDQSSFFQGMPKELNPNKKQALSWMFDVDFGLGGKEAVVTSAMWAGGERFTAVEPWEDVFDNSGWACSEQLLPPDTALEEWWNGMGLSGNGQLAASSLYRRRMGSPDSVITLESWEWETYLEAAEIDLIQKKWPPLVNYWKQ